MRFRRISGQYGLPVLIRGQRYIILTPSIRQCVNEAINYAYFGAYEKGDTTIIVA